MAEQFTGMFRRKAFLHWYTGEGMDEAREFFSSSLRTRGEVNARSDRFLDIDSLSLKESGVHT